MKRRLLVVGAPIIAVLTFMLGLRIGAGEAVRAVTVFGAPLAAPAPDGKTRVSWQMLTFLDDRGVKETIAMTGLTAIARARGQGQTWQGASNADGVAELSFTFDGLATGDPLELEVREAGDPQPLAKGTVTWTPVSPTSHAASAVRPTVREGAIDVVIEGDRLVTGFPTSLWVRAAPGIAVSIDPEPGLLAERTTAKTCDSGWAELPVTAQAHVTGAAINIEGGKWFGALPVVPGAFFVSVPRALPATAPQTAVLIAPNPRAVVYAELDDSHGRVAAAALEVKTEPGDPTPRARFDLPALAPGLYWIVVSGEPRGAESISGATTAKAIWVGDTPPEGGISVQSACSIGPWLAQKSAGGFPRWRALDGLPARSAENRRRHTLGMAIGLLSLLAAGILESLLLIAAAREARIAMQLEELEENAPPLTAKSPGGSLAIAILIAVLGLALLAVLLVAKA